MGGGSTSKSGSAQKWAKPFAQAAAGDVQGVYNANQPGINSLTSQVQGLVPGLIGKYNAGDPALNASENYTTSTLGRDPYAGSSQLDALIANAQGHVRDQVGAAFGSRGSFGGTAWETALAKGLADSEVGARQQDVQNNQQLQAQAAGLAPQQAAAQYLGISPVLAAATAGSQIPYQGINAQSTDLASLFQGGKTTQSNGIGGILQGVGSIGSAVGSMGQAGMFSDRRMKQDIEKLGEFPDGLGVYEFAYKWEPENRYAGVMADEVAELRPWALGAPIDGFATVNYGAL